MKAVRLKRKSTAGLGLVGLVALALGLVLVVRSFPMDRLRVSVLDHSQTSDDNIEDFVQSSINVDGGTITSNVASVSSISSETIPVQLNFHRMISSNGSSLLTCTFSVEMIREALSKTAELWRRHANIELLYDKVMPPTQVPPQMDQEYIRHYQKYTSRNAGTAALVSTELSKILHHDRLSPWEQKNVIHVYCIGAFVGNNAVTDHTKIFIRTQRARKEEALMDLPRFIRVLAHEIGHAFNLRHPKPPFCHQSCILNQCNLMCQQKIFPKSRDGRYALSLTLLQVAVAREQAATMDTFGSNVGQNQVVEGVITERLGETKPNQGPLILAARSITENLRVTRVRFKLTRFLPCKVALVTVAMQNQANGPPPPGSVTKLKILAVGMLSGDVEQSRNLHGSDRGNVSSLELVDFHPTWWSEKRHLELDVIPAVDILVGERWGLLFSSSLITVPMTKSDRHTFGLSRDFIKHQKLKPIDDIFESVVALGQIELTSLEYLDAVEPVMNLVGEYT